MFHLVFLLLTFSFVSSELSTDEFYDGVEVCVKIKHSLMGAFDISNSEATPEGFLNWRKDLYAYCVAMQWEPTCHRMRYTLGKFYTCYESIYFDDSIKKNELFQPRGKTDCELSDIEMAKLTMLIGNKCGPAAVKNMNDSERYAKQILCHFPFNIFEPDE